MDAKRKSIDPESRKTGATQDDAFRGGPVLTTWAGCG